MNISQAKLLLLNVYPFCLTAVSAFADEPLPVDMIEFRVQTPPAVGALKLDVGAQMNAPSGHPAFVKAKDGRIMMFFGSEIRYSTDKGKTWSAPEKMSRAVQQVIQLNSGNLGGVSGNRFYVSDDEGKTWEGRGAYSVGSAQGASPYPNTLIQTRSGRILLPMRWTGGAGHNGLYDMSMSWGTIQGKLVPVEGHAHYPEPDNGLVCYSDDEGKTWARSEGGIMIWHKEGYGGMWPCDEPSLVETRNGDVVMLMRTTLGRVYSARSRTVEYVNHAGKRFHHTPGQRFDHPQPTELAGSYSPCAVDRIQKTGHWLIVWNQVSGDEIRGSYRRGRLCSAISEDDGATWKHFRTIDTSVLPPVGKVKPDPKPRMARGLDYVGVLPDDYGSVSYPTVKVVDEVVFVVWQKSVVRPRPGDQRGTPMRVLPLSWFYQDEPPPKPGPKLFLKVPAHDAAGDWNTFEIPARYYNGRFFCHLKDLAVYLKSPVGRLGYSMYAPLHQVITCLGWTPAYDRSKLDDPKDPRLTVICTHPHSAPQPRTHAPLPDTPGAVILTPLEGVPVELYGVPVGAKKKLVFKCPFASGQIKKAWLDVLVDDIDAPKEATIMLNGKTSIQVDKSVIGEGEGHKGRLTVPTDGLIKGKNTFEFVFADNLGGETQGYIITEAMLVLVVD